MKSVLIVSCLVLSTSAQLGGISHYLKTFLSPDSSQQHVLKSQHKIVMPSTGDDTAAPDFSGGIIISDVIGKDQEIAIFSGLTRDIDTVSSRLDDSAQNATVLAPDNGIMRGLPRKPWEDPEDYAQLGASAYEGQDGEDRAHRNLRRFVEAHIVPHSPWGENQKIETLAGNTIWYEEKGGKKIVSFEIKCRSCCRANTFSDTTGQHRSCEHC
jgi:hypothetical protein